MKVNLKDNNQWIANKQKKKIQRIRILIILVVALISSTTASVLYTRHSIKTGKIYPKIVLADAPSGSEPIVQTTNGYNKVVKCPSLPYTMMVGGDVVSEGETSCTLLIEGDYLSICETDSLTETTTFVTQSLIPLLGTQTQKFTTFNQQKGYLNERYIETEANTIVVGENNTLYTMSYRIYLENGKDILLVGMSTDTDMESLNKRLQTVFYTIHKLAIDETADSKTPTVQEPVGDIENIILKEDMQTSDGEPMDAEFFEEGDIYDPTRNENHLHEKPEDVMYKADEEKTVTVDKEYGEAVFVFSYTTEAELASIILYDPAGNSYYPTEIKTNKTDPYTLFPAYAFMISNPEQGEWKFVYTATDSIGYYQGYITTLDLYNASQNQTQLQNRNNE